MTTMSQRSWISIITEIDPEFYADSRLRTPEYRFSNQRPFRQRPGDWYATAGGTETST